MPNYPLVFGDTVMQTYQDFKNEGLSPKEAWKLASSMHRGHARTLSQIAYCDTLIPYQANENWS